MKVVTRFINRRTSEVIDFDQYNTLMEETISALKNDIKLYTEWYSKYVANGPLKNSTIDEIADTWEDTIEECVKEELDAEYKSFVVVR